MKLIHQTIKEDKILESMGIEPVGPKDFHFNNDFENVIRHLVRESLTDTPEWTRA
jgi:hypothetical protein